MRDNFTTGELIALKRKEKGYTQIELAKLLGVSNKAISKWETDNGMPDISLIIPLGNILNLSTNELLNGTPSKINKIKLKLYNQRKDEDLNKLKKNIIIYNLLNFIIFTFFILVSYFLIQNIFIFNDLIPSVGKLMSNIGYILIFISIILIITSFKNAFLKDKLYLISLPHLIFSIVSAFKYLSFLHSMDFTIKISLMIFIEILSYYFLGLAITLILYITKYKKTENN